MRQHWARAFGRPKESRNSRCRVAAKSLPPQWETPGNDKEQYHAKRQQQPPQAKPDAGRGAQDVPERRRGGQRPPGGAHRAQRAAGPPGFFRRGLQRPERGALHRQQRRAPSRPGLSRPLGPPPVQAGGRAGAAGRRAHPGRAQPHPGGAAGGPAGGEAAGGVGRAVRRGPGDHRHGAGGRRRGAEGGPQPPGRPLSGPPGHAGLCGGGALRGAFGHPGRGGGEGGGPLPDPAGRHHRSPQPGGHRALWTASPIPTTWGPSCARRSAPGPTAW